MPLGQLLRHQALDQWRIESRAPDLSHRRIDRSVSIAGCIANGSQRDSIENLPERTNAELGTRLGRAVSRLRFCRHGHLFWQIIRTGDRLHEMKNNRPADNRSSRFAGRWWIALLAVASVGRRLDRVSWSRVARASPSIASRRWNGTPSRAETSPGKPVCLAAGGSGPIVVRGRVFCSPASSGEPGAGIDCVAVCVAADSGKQLWEGKILGHRPHAMPSEQCAAA